MMATPACRGGIGCRVKRGDNTEGDDGRRAHLEGDVSRDTSSFCSLSLFLPYSVLQSANLCVLCYCTRSIFPSIFIFTHRTLFSLLGSLTWGFSYHLW